MSHGVSALSVYGDARLSTDGHPIHFRRHTPKGTRDYRNIILHRRAAVKRNFDDFDFQFAKFCYIFHAKFFHFFSREIRNFAISPFRGTPILKKIFVYFFNYRKITFIFLSFFCIVLSWEKSCGL